MKFIEASIQWITVSSAANQESANIEQRREWFMATRETN